MVYKIIVQASFPPFSVKLAEEKDLSEPPKYDVLNFPIQLQEWINANKKDLSEPPKYDVLNFPIQLQEWINANKKDYMKRHPNVYPNVLVIQDNVLLSHHFPRYIIEMNPKDRPDWFKKEFSELSRKLKKWQGSLLFEWMGMKIYNRGHVIGNRDFPLTFLEVR